MNARTHARTHARATARHADTSFSVRLDDIPQLNFGGDRENVVAIYVDASYGTGWWCVVSSLSFFCFHSKRGVIILLTAS
jgi:hypothetical protein